MLRSQFSPMCTKPVHEKKTDKHDAVLAKPLKFIPALEIH